MVWWSWWCRVEQLKWVNICSVNTLTTSGDHWFIYQMIFKISSEMCSMTVMRTRRQLFSNINKLLVKIFLMRDNKNHCPRSASSPWPQSLTIYPKEYSRFCRKLQQNFVLSLTCSDKWSECETATVCFRAARNWCDWASVLQLCQKSFNSSELYQLSLTVPGQEKLDESCSISSKLHQNSVWSSQEPGFILQTAQVRVLSTQSYTELVSIVQT